MGTSTVSPINFLSYYLSLGQIIIFSKDYEVSELILDDQFLCVKNLEVNKV